MPKVSVYDKTGQPVREIDLSDVVFAAEVRPDLMHAAVVAEQANARLGTADTKTRGEVRGGGRKPWRQKGTGRARQGSIRAPHWRHGGVVFGPHPRDYSQRLPKKMRRAAMRSALTAKLEENAIVTVENIHFDEIKTRHAVQFLKGLNIDDPKRVLILLPQHDEVVWKSFRNLPGVEVRISPAVSVRDMLIARRVITTPEALQKLEEVCAR
ncbi:MAG: 50S ribosomal protein L4 [Firmicutes bacterium]|nr:50S ribosomal protein L4 [Bacillota bacterium]